MVFVALHLVLGLHSCDSSSCMSIVSHSEHWTNMVIGDSYSVMTEMYKLKPNVQESLFGSSRAADDDDCEVDDDKEDHGKYEAGYGT